MKNNLAPFEVAPYSADYITNVIRYVTRWSSRGEVLDKAHIAYLKNYLNKLQVRTVVFESEYIDRHYLEDYSEYYARCFQSIPKTCARLHFFTTEFSEEQFANALNESDSKFIETSIKAGGSYAGFVVIRPLPVTCIARMCLSPYELGDKAHILKEDITVSLFGIDLTLKTAAFIEQDKVVSACATSAIWALLNANRTFRSDQLPSPSSITKSALVADREGGRTFPAAKGLKVEHVCRSLKTYGLEPTVIDFAEYENANSLQEVKRILAAYLPSGIPVLMGGEVTHIDNAGKKNQLGNHLVCALGFKASESTELSIPHKHTTKIYVHDDRYGPYVALEDTQCGQAFDFQLVQESDGKTTTLRNENFSPKVLIIGLNHKIRIDYDYAYNTSAALIEIVLNAVADLENSNIPEGFSELSNCEFRVELTHGATIKREYFQNNTPIFSFNGTSEPSAFLTENIPKYLWRCRFISNNNLFADILIDATGIPQGDLLIGYIAYTVLADACWRSLGGFISTSYYKNATADLDFSLSHIMGCITRFFQNFEPNYLDAYYGPLRLPTRKYRASELDDQGDQIKRVDILKIVRGSDAATQIERLKKDVPQIWVIDQFGDLIIGDEPVSSENKMGHPALTGGGPARLGGELRYVEEDDCWEINTKSGTYSSHLRNTPEKSNRYLKSVLEHNLRNCKVKQETSAH